MCMSRLECGPAKACLGKSDKMPRRSLGGSVWRYEKCEEGGDEEPCEHEGLQARGSGAQPPAEQRVRRRGKGGGQGQWGQAFHRLGLSWARPSTGPKALRHRGEAGGGCKGKQRLQTLIQGLDTLGTGVTAYVGTVARLSKHMQALSTVLQSHAPHTATAALAHAHTEAWERAMHTHRATVRVLRGGVLDPLCEALEAQEEAPHSKQHTGHSMAQRAIRGLVRQERAQAFKGQRDTIIEHALLVLCASQEALLAGLSQDLTRVVQGCGSGRVCEAMDDTRHCVQSLIAGGGPALPSVPCASRDSTPNPLHHSCPAGLDNHSPHTHGPPPPKPPRPPRISKGKKKDNR